MQPQEKAKHTISESGIFVGSTTSGHTTQGKTLEELENKLKMMMQSEIDWLTHALKHPIEFTKVDAFTLR